MALQVGVQRFSKYWFGLAYNKVNDGLAANVTPINHTSILLNQMQQLCYVSYLKGGLLNTRHGTRPSDLE